MKVHLQISDEYYPPHAEIFADKVTPEIEAAVDFLGNSAGAVDAPITAQREDRLFVLRPSEIYMARVEGGETILYTKKERFYSRKRLYEILGPGDERFMQISKQCIINLLHIHSVEASLGGTLLLHLDNGLFDYVSRKYLPDFKKYLQI